MGIAGACLAVGLSWWAGAIALALAWPERRPGRWAFVLGYGYIAGMIATGLLLRMQAALTGSLNPLVPTVVLGAGSAAATFLAWRSSRGPRVGGAGPVGVSHPHVSPLAARVLVAALLAWLALRFGTWLIEVSHRGIYPWDAWTTWAYRARAWIQAGELAAFVSPEAWLAAPTGTAYAAAASQYPLTPSYMVAWPVLAYGSWNEPAANLPWLGLALALGLTMYGQARLWGASALSALVGVWLLGSLPILGSHVALAGYFDLWMAATLGCAFVSFLRWSRWRETRDAVVAAAMAAACLLLKNEGTVWVLFFLPAVLALWVTWRGWLTVVVIAAVGLALLGVTGGFGFDWPGGGRVAISLDRLDLPRIGVIEFGVEPGVLGAVAVHLFVFDSWHLAVYAFLGTLVLYASTSLWGQAWRSEGAWHRAGLAWVLSAVAGFLVLFFLTGASEWARRGTSVNRILLQFAPALLFWSLTVWWTVLESMGRGAAASGATGGDSHSAQSA